MNLKFIQPLLAAIRFITIIPVGKTDRFDPGGMVPFFPLVGLMIGFLLWIFDGMVAHLWSRPVVAVLDVVFLAALSGAFHLDGLADTADGLFSHRSREQAMMIMKDSRVGAMGLVTITLSLALKWAGITELGDPERLALIIVPAYARAGILFGIKFLPYGRPDGGTGHGFFENPLSIRAFSGLAVIVALSFFLGWMAIFINIMFTAITVVLLILFKKSMGCITGDMLGAMCEVTESVLFLMMAIHLT